MPAASSNTTFSTAKEIAVSEQPREFTNLLDRAAQGDQQAAQELYDKYNQAIVQVVRFRLERMKLLRKLHDTDDFTQLIWQDFFARVLKGGRFEAVEDMTRFLTALANNHVRKAARKHLAKKRDLRRERNLGTPNVSSAAECVADKQPTPAQQAETNDSLQRWLQMVGPQDRQIFLLIRDGLTSEQIAEMTGCSMRTVERLRHRFRTALLVFRRVRQER